MPADIVDLEKAKRGRLKPEPLAEWKRDMLHLADGKGIKSCDYNAGHALLYCPEFSRKIGFDVRRQQLMALDDTPAGPKGGWTDSHTAALAMWLQRERVPVTASMVNSALAGCIVHGFQVDPLADYLTGLEWDGQERIGTWLADYCQAERSDANSIMGSKFLIGAVARALQPGCRMDNMLVLEGPQGARKSTLVRTLAAEWTGEGLPDFHSRDAMQIAGSKWIIEVGELAAVRRSELEHIKSFLTRLEDLYVPKYQRHPITVKRWSVLVGNLNPDNNGWLRDTTGNRRFWPVTVGAVDIEAVERDRNQLWAEAVFCYRRKDPWHISGDSETEPVAAQQELRRETDAWEQIIEKYLLEEPTERWDGSTEWQRRPEKVGTITCEDIALKALRMHPKEINRSVETRIGNAMKNLGYDKKRIRINGRLTWVFVVPTE